MLINCINNGITLDNNPLHGIHITVMLVVLNNFQFNNVFSAILCILKTPFRERYVCYTICSRLGQVLS